MRKAFRFRIYPNKNSEVKSIRAISICRHLYNDSLGERKKQATLNRLKKQFDVFPWGKPEWIYYEDQANDLSESKPVFQK
jgi:transposase